MNQGLKLRANRFFNLRNVIFIICSILVIAIAAIFTKASIKSSFAKASTADFRPGNIISDAIMGKYDSMSKDDIQHFLTSKNNCSNTNYSQYLQLKSRYPNLEWHFENGHFICLSEERFGDGSSVGSGQTAAEIIYQAAQDYRINPQVLLVLLEKEQSLISDTYPNTKQYRIATGFGCPDTAACDTKYYGFKNQVRNAASMFRSVLDGGWSNYPAYRTSYIQYNPNTSCGGSNVYIENRATSALYRYTPYQPNSSALSAGYGTGDVCGAYGNRNFYLFFTDWFGSTQARVDGTSIVIPEGIYGLVSKANFEQSIEVEGSVTHSGANVSTWHRNTSGSWQWRFSRGADGYYTITNVKSGKVLETASESVVNGTNTRVADTNSSCAQKWKVYQTPDNYLTLESACSAGMVLDMASGATTSGTNLQTYIANNTDAQKWQIYAGPTINNGTYTLNSELEKNKVIDVSGGQTSDGTNIQVWGDADVPAQKWTFTYNASGDYYTIKNPISNRVLDLHSASTDNGSNVQLWISNNTCAQQWKIVPTLSGKYTLISNCSINKVLDIKSGIIFNGANVQVYESNNTPAQKWEIKPSSMFGSSMYNVSSRLNSNKVVDISGGAEAARVGTNIQLWEANQTAAQKWTVTYNSAKDAYVLTNPATRKVLYLASGSTRSVGNYSNVQLGNADGTCSQFWKVSQNSDGSFSFISSCASSKVIEARSGETANGTNIHLWDSNWTTAQKWSLSVTY